MKRITFALAAMLMMLLLFAACSSAPTEVAAAEEEIRQEVVQADTWQEAYATLLRQYAQLPSYFYYNWGGAGWEFFLHDINRDGIPELIILDRFSGRYTGYFVAYTFTDGAVVQLTTEYHGAQFFTRPGNSPGIITVTGHGAYDSTAIMVLDGHKLAIEAKVSVNDADAQLIWRVNNETVTQEEHDRKRDIISADHDDWRLILTHKVNEDNIRDVIAGWSPAVLFLLRQPHLYTARY